VLIVALFFKAPNQFLQKKKEEAANQFLQKKTTANQRAYDFSFFLSSKPKGNDCDNLC